MKLSVTAEDAALRQVNAGIRMYLNDEDPVATHTVVAAALECLDKLLIKAGKRTTQETIKAYVIAEKQDEVIDMIRKPQNFFKHGGDEPVTFNPELVENFLLSCCIAVTELNIELSKEMRVFQLGMSINYPEILMDSDFKNQIMELRNTLHPSPTHISRIQLLKLLESVRQYQK